VRTSALGALLALAAACSGGDDDDATDGGADGGDPRPECAPALALDPADTTASPLQILELAASGGTGDYRFTLVESPSGGSIDERRGAYLAGGTGGVTDVVRLEDFGCQGSAEARIDVRAPLDVAPRDIELAPGTSFTLEITGGSGEHTCALDEGGSGATLDAACRYTAGAAAGHDRIVVDDTVTGERAASNVTVTPGAGLRVAPPVVALPVGSTFALTVQGGSGEVTLSADAAAIAGVEGETVRGLAAGRTTVEVVDRFTGVSAAVRVDVVAALTAEVPRTGDGTMDVTVLAPGDLGSDGHPDAIVALAEADLEAYNGGAVLVYHGRADGLEAAPAQIFAGTGWEEELGRGIALGDFDGDGRDDLVIGAPRAAMGHDGAGAVRIHAGLANATFAEEPFVTLSGDWWSDWFGERVAVCDFDGDGDPDLAVSAPLAEDRDQASPPNDQGAVLVFLQDDEAGLPIEPTTRIFGRAPNDAGVLVDVGGLQLGWGLAAADVDADGACDLVVGTQQYDSVAGGNSGLAAVYRGDPELGVRAEPSLVWGGLNPREAGAELGRAVAAGDLDGDGMAEIVVGEWHHDSQDEGAVRVFQGRELGDSVATAVAPADDADWIAVGTPWDNLGWAPFLADVDGDGRTDLVAGALFDEDDLGALWDAGGLVVWAGRDGALPDLAPTRKIFGLANGDRFGLGAAVLGEVDGDGAPDLAVFAGFEDSLGWDVGRPFYVSGATGAATPLDLPGEAAGKRIGDSMAVVPDVDGDGLDDLFVGAPGAPHRADLMRSGEGLLYRGRAGGSFEEAPAMRVGGFSTHGGWQALGTDVGTAGDFDGDGANDLAIVGGWTPMPPTFDATFANPNECAPGVWRWGSGALFVLRGGDGALPSATPSFAYYGPEDNSTIQRVRGGFDFDGDGLDDLLASSPWWDGVAGQNTGGVALLRGRDRAANGLTTVVCAPDWILHGAGVNWGYGASMAVLGDLDADGCDEVAVGVPGEAHADNQYWRGAVHVLWGAGASCARSEVEETVVVGAFDWAQVGTSMDAGEDVDGDHVPDLAVSGVYLSVRGDTVGAAWVVSGAYLAGLPRAAAGDGTLADAPMPLTPGTGVWRVEGRVQGEELGRGVALVPGASGRGRAGLAVGGPLADLSGAFGSGGVRVHRFVTGDPILPDGLDPEPIAVFGGETDPLYSYLGSRVGAAVVDGVTLLVTSAPRSDALGLDCGAVYAVPID